MNEPEPGPKMENKCPQCGATLPTGALQGLCPACLLQQGAAAETATQPEMGQFEPPSLQEMAAMFPQLEILSLIGKGGMGAVYKARQPALDRLVALKILPPQVASGPGFADRFNREARALARLSHPNIVAVHEFGQVNGIPFFIMEFVDGLNLRQLERAGKLSPREALQIVPQICEALQFAHDEGIVHRDIKPENILLDKKGRVKIADFGIAKIMGREAEMGSAETRGVIGTPQYMAPEQVEKPETVDHRADIFSLGVVFYEMLTGELPLGKFAPPSRKVEVDVRLDDVVLRALEKEPDRRYQHASQVKSAVNTISSAAGTPPREAAQALGQEILATDYELGIGSCLSRGWALLTSDFWPIVGITLLMMLLVQAATSTAVGIVAGGPLMGGLWLYLLKRARGEPAGIETAFSGFRLAFVDLFLVGLVATVLKILGFICLILPGIYLVVAWMFASILVIDKGLDFWGAMELSRKVVTRHWWKAFGFVLVLLLVNLGGLLLCGLGFLITTPLTLAATVYAYEDIFGTGRRTAGVAAGVRTGPSGTKIVSPTEGAYAGVRGWKLAGVLMAALVLLLFVMALGASRARQSRQEAYRAQAAAREREIAAAAIPEFSYGAVQERLLELTNVTRRALNLVSGNYVTSTPDGPLDWDNLSTEKLQSAGVDLYLKGGAPEADTNHNQSITPQLSTLGFRALSPVVADDSNISNAVYAATQSDTQEQSRTTGVEAAINGTQLMSFVTRDGTEGLLQLANDIEDGSSVRVRYKLLEKEGSSGPPGREAARMRLRESLEERLEAAGSISGSEERGKAFARVAMDAARAGEPDIVETALQSVNNMSVHDQTALDAVRVLAKRHLRRQGIAIARNIYSNEMRDRALAELAQ